MNILHSPAQCNQHIAYYLNYSIFPACKANTRTYLLLLKVKISALLLKYHPLIVPKEANEFINKCSSSLIKVLTAYLCVKKFESDLPVCVVWVDDGLPEKTGSNH